MIVINYNFYEEYLENEEFSKMFQIRKSYVKNKDRLKYSDDELVKERFVEIFSWTVIKKNLLFEINKIICEIVPNGIIIDPCSGNSFHTFLFKTFCNREVITIDIQPEENAWIKTLEQDGLEYLKNMKIHDNKILILSWIDYTGKELSYNLLKSFKGNLVISIGNYREINSKKYLDELKSKYEIINSYDCMMPWNMIEEIRIFKKILKVYLMFIYIRWI